MVHEKHIKYIKKNEKIKNTNYWSNDRLPWCCLGWACQFCPEIPRGAVESTESVEPLSSTHDTTSCVEAWLAFEGSAVADSSSMLRSPSTYWILMGCWLHYQLRVSLILFLQFGLSSSILQHCTVRVSPWQVQIWLWETHAQKQSMKHERLVCDLIRRPPQHCFHGLHILALPKFSSFHSVAFNPRKGEPPRHCKSCSCSVKHSLYSDLEGIEEPNDLHLSTIHHKQR